MPLPVVRDGPHPTQGYFLAYRGLGNKGKEKQWLDKKIDHIKNGVSINYAKYGNFKDFQKWKVIAAKKQKSSFFSFHIWPM
jgi:hypothetical protein